MLSNRTESVKNDSLIINNNEIIVKQLTTPFNKFDIHFDCFSKEQEKITSTFSFQDDLLDKKAYDFIKTKDECLAIMKLDDSIPEQKAKKIIESINKNKDNIIKVENSKINN